MSSVTLYIMYIHKNIKDKMIWHVRHSGEGRQVRNGFQGELFDKRPNVRPGMTYHETTGSISE